jgi:hypothetical protein
MRGNVYARAILTATIPFLSGCGYGEPTYGLAATTGMPPVAKHFKKLQRADLAD